MATKIESEKLLEKKLREAIRRLGGWCLKFISPGVSGVPDRIVLLPGGKVLFVEVKTTKKKPSPVQRWVHAKLARLGFPVWVIDNSETLATFIDLCGMYRESIKR